MSERFDIVLVGLDPERDRSEVIGALARRLHKSTEELDRLVTSAPSTIARALPIPDAQALVEELRELGVRLKPQPATEIDPDAPPAKIELLYWSTDDEGYERPRDEAIPIDPPIDPPSVTPIVETPIERPIEPPLVAPKPPTPIVVRDEGEWHAPASIPTGAAALVLTPIAAKHGRAETLAPDRPERPRHFFAALPSALLLPFAREVRRELAWASLLGALAVGVGAIGVRLEAPWGPLLVALATVAAVGHAGLVLQIASACLGAAARGDPAPPPLPTRLMDDYLGPGIGVLAAITTVATAATLVIGDLHRRGAPTWLMVTLGGVATVHGVLGFALSAASGSPRGFVALVRMSRLVFGSPLRIQVVIAIGGLAVAAVAGAVLAIAASLEAVSPLTVVVDTLAIAAPLVAVAGYLAVATAITLGALAYADPDAFAP